MSITPISVTKRAGKLFADGVFGGLHALRRLLPVRVDDALFHLPRCERSVDDVPEIGLARLGVEHACKLEPAVDLGGKRWAGLDGPSPGRSHGLVFARVPRGRILGRRCAVIAAEGVLLREISPFLWADRPVSHPELRRHAWLPQPRRIEGTVIVAGNAGAGNFYHWISEGLRRLLETLRHAEREGVDVSRARIAVSAARLAAVDECLRALGFGEERVVRMHRFDQIEADEVLAVSVPTCTLGMTVEGARTLHGFRLAAPAGPRPRRFVILRRGLRSFVDDSVVLEALAPFGFEPVRLETLDLAAQQALFAGAEAIVAPHGAGLVNLVWTTGPCAVLEIFPWRYQNPCFRQVCSAADAGTVGGRGIRHAFIVGPAPRASADRAAERIEVDPALLGSWASRLT